MVHGESRVAIGEWRVASGEWRVARGARRVARACPLPPLDVVAPASEAHSSPQHSSSVASRSASWPRSPSPTTVASSASAASGAVVVAGTSPCSASSVCDAGPHARSAGSGGGSDEPRPRWPDTGDLPPPEPLIHFVVRGMPPALATHGWVAQENRRRARAPALLCSHLHVVVHALGVVHAPVNRSFRPPAPRRSRGLVLGALIVHFASRALSSRLLSSHGTQAHASRSPRQAPSGCRAALSSAMLRCRSCGR